MFRPWTFRTLCTAVAVVFVLATGAVSVSIWRDRANAIDDGVRDAHNIAVVLGGQIARSIQSVDLVLRAIQRRLDEAEAGSTSGSIELADPGQFRDMLLDRLRGLPQAMNIAVADGRGRLIVTTSAWPTPDMNIADREYFKDLAAGVADRLTISLPFDNRITGEPILVLARRISGAGHAFRGIVFTAVRRSYFESIYGAVNSLPHQSFALLRPDGTVIIRNPDPQNSSGQKIPADFPFHTLVRSGGGSYRSPGAFDSVVRWAAVSVLNDYPLVVNIAVPEEVVLRNWRERAISAVAVTLALFTCALVLLSIMARQYRNLSRSQSSLAEKSNELDAALNNMSQGLAMFDVDGQLVICNERFRELLQFSPEQLQPGIHLRDIAIHCHDAFGFPANVDDYMSEIAAIVSTRQSFAYEVQDFDGRIICVRNEPMPGNGYIATFQDITDRRVDEAKIRRLTHNDVLTGIANRSRFLDQVDKALRASGQTFTVLMLDLDHFKHVNDSLGHAAGDILLQEAARRLEAALRATDVLARLGGDEFAIIQMPRPDIKGCDDASAAMRQNAITLANRIIEVIGQPCDIAGHKVVIGVSIGIAMAPINGAEPVELMKKADLALYRAKSDGRNGYAFFEPEMATTANERHQLEGDLRAGLARDEFELHYQPLIDVASGEAHGMEALVRWRHPVHGPVAPDRFIPLAEETGLIIPLGDWILQTACAEAATWPPHVKVAVNISPVQFRKTNLFDVILCALVDANLPPERLEVEITERVLLDNDADYLSTLHQLKNLGVAIVLDDFGTGYSSLSYLKMFPFDKIKIDRSFTTDLLERPDCAAIICAVINLGRSLDIKTVAEGVETSAQFAALRAAGVTQVQGYLFGRPMPATEIAFAVGAGTGETARLQA